MALAVDVDEADIEVLGLNLAESKELFTAISKSLNNISKKSYNASNRIKPVLKEVNKLNEARKELDSGLNLLSEVSEYAKKTSAFEMTLNSSIEITGVQKFLSTLIKSKTLLKEMKNNIKNFKGILINFENLINQADLKLENYFQKCFRTQPQGSSKINEIALIFKYFYSNGDQDTINRIFIRSASTRLVDSMKTYEEATVPSKRKSNIPYEKGSNGINKYNNELIKIMKSNFALILEIGRKLEIPMLEQAELQRGINSPYLNERYTGILNKYFDFFLSQPIISNDSFILEVIENVAHFERFLNINALDPRDFSGFNDGFKKLVRLANGLFPGLMENCERRIKLMERFTDLSITETTVELVSRLRKIMDYRSSLLRLISGVKLGSWLNHKPPLKFIGVYTSVIPNISSDIDENSPEYLLSCFLSDYLDCIFVNMEIGMKQDVSIKKSMEGFFLVKNLVMVETIINRTQALYDTLGSMGKERLTKLKNRYLKLFLDDWNYASYIIIRDMTNITTANAASGHSSGSMSNKEREQIKDLFRSFNESFEEALKNYEKYNITDENLRNYLSSEIKKLVLNAYFKLYDKYGSGEFTKNRAKYIKYDKAQFERLLNDRL